MQSAQSHERVRDAARHDQDGAGGARATRALRRSTTSSASPPNIAGCSTTCWHSSRSYLTYDLDIMTEDQTLTEITTRVLVGMEPVLIDAHPDVVLVHGDTTTSTAAALAAFYAQIPVGHVEAGLRTQNRWLPYPEEMNRRLTATIASYHFAPRRSRANTCCESTSRSTTSSSRATPSSTRSWRLRRAPTFRRPRDGTNSTRSGRRSSSPRIAARTSVHARDLRRAPRDRRASRRVRSSIGRCIRRRASRRSPTQFSTRSRRRFGRTDRLRRDGRGGEECHVRADRFGRTSRGGPVPRQAGARDARGDRTARRPRRRYAGARRARPAKDRRGRSPAAGGAPQRTSDGPGREPVWRRVRGRADRRLALGAAPGRCVPRAVCGVEARARCRS